MGSFLLVLQIVLSTLLIGLIMVQARGKGLSSAWGGGSASFSRRGLERLIFRGTFFVSGLFILLSILQIFV
jgi:protein translocase SecG subunit